MPLTSPLSVFIFSFAVTFGAVVTPGPVSAAIVSQSPRRGWITGPLISTGHALTELVMVGLIAFGLASLLANPAIQAGVAWLGGALLVWMGVSMLISAIRGTARLPHDSGMEPAMSSGRLFLLGLGATVTNPFWFAWWGTVAAGYLAQARAAGVEMVAAFYVGHISADYGWNTLLSTLLGGGRRWITTPIYRGLIGLCGIFLAYLGVTFILRGLGT